MKGKLREVEIGERRIRKLREKFEEERNFVLDNRDFNAGIDILVILKEGRIKALEVTNYAEKTVYGELEYIPDYKLDRYISSLNRFDKLLELGYQVEKILVVSFDSNLSKDQLTRLKANNIDVWVLGYQD